MEQPDGAVAAVPVDTHVSDVGLPLRVDPAVGICWGHAQRSNKGMRIAHRGGNRDRGWLNGGRFMGYEWLEPDRYISAIASAVSQREAVWKPLVALGCKDDPTPGVANGFRRIGHGDSVISLP